MPDRIVTGQRLIGRESRISRLRSAVERAREERRPRLVSVTGAMGVGKSAVLGAFVDQLGEDVLVGAAAAVPDAGPFATLATLLDSLAGSLAGTFSTAPRPPAALELVEAIGSGADLLLDLAPAWCALLGPPAPREISARVQRYRHVPNPEHVRNRLQLMLRRLFGALGRDTPCVVLVIDDLHHADFNSVDALAELLAAGGPLVVVGAYRAKEIGPEHPLRVLLDTAPQRSAALTLELRPLPDPAITEMVADALGLSIVDAQALSSVIVSGTGSNPFAVEQLLHWLAEQGLLIYDPVRATWTWQMDRITAVAPVAARIGALIQSRLNRLSPAMRDLLRTAALVGDRFELGDLAGPDGEPSPGLADRLRLAVHLEMFRQVGAEPPVYAWAHSLVRDTVLENVPAHEQAAAAAALLASAPRTRLFERLARAETGAAPSMRRAELHLSAGLIAAGRGATEVAYRHLRAGLAVLPATAWRRRYPLAFALHVEAALAARALRDGAAVDELLDLVQEQACDDLDRAAVSRARLVLRWTRRGLSCDPTPALEALRLLGIRLPADDEDWTAAAHEAVTCAHARLSEVDLNRPSMVDDRARFAADLIAEVLFAVQADANLSAVLAARGVELALDYGPGPGSGCAFASFGVAVATRLDDEDAARRCAEAALALCGTDTDPYVAGTKASVAVALPFLAGTVESTLALLREAYGIALERGDISFAMATLLQRPNCLLAIGAPIDKVATEVAASVELLGVHGRYPAGQVIADAVNDAVGRLRGTTTTGGAPAGSPLAAQARRGELGYVSSLQLTVALMTAYLLGEYADALALAEAAENVPTPYWARFLASEQRFYHALTLAACYPSGDVAQRRQWTDKLVALQRELERWAEHRPAGFAHKALLVSAEQARLAGDIETAMGRYERVIGGSRENGFLHIQAIAAEIGGRCGIAHADPVEALAYLRRARTCYARWGAHAKVDQLDKLLAGAPSPTRPAHPVDQLDLLNVVKAFQTISSVLDLDKLTATLLELLVHHTGAQRGYLLLNEEGALRLAAEARNDSDLVAVVRKPAVEIASCLPMTLVEHAVGSGEPVLSGDGDDAFAADPYLLEHRPRAFLAAPIAHQDRLIGVLYLEHRHRADAFGPGQLDGLEVLCTQAAICLDNAAVYAELAEANRILDATFDRLPVGLIVLRTDLTVHRASPHAVHLLGLPISVGTPLVDLIDVLTPVDSAGRPLRLEFERIGGPEAWEGMRREVVIVRPDGQRQHLDSWSIPLRDAEGRLLGVTLLVTER